MARRRFFVPIVRGGEAELTGEEARHLTQVLRVEAGQLYEISDNQQVYLAEVDTARKQHVVFRILEPLPPQPAPVPVTLLAALVKFERMETMIEKATELGVASIGFVKAERSEKGLELAAPKRMHRWERIALEASQQSRRAHLPVLAGPMPLREALRREADYRLFLDEEPGGRSLLDVVTGRGSAALLVGPEGGWPGHEREAARDAGWTPVTLGPQILRAETAAIAALATLNAIFYR